MTKKSYSYCIANAIKRFLKEDDWRFYFHEDRGVFEFTLGVDKHVRRLHYLIDVDEDKYIVYATSPLGADGCDKDTMAIMAEFVCRANYNLLNGNFELDMRDGELRYKTFVDCSGAPPSIAIIRDSILCPAAMFRRYDPGIVQIVVKGASAKEAVEACERDDDDEIAVPSPASTDTPDDESITAMLERIAAEFDLRGSVSEETDAQEEPVAQEETDSDTAQTDADGEAALDDFVVDDIISQLERELDDSDTDDAAQ